MKKALEAFPNYAPGQYWTGVCYLDLQQFREAIPYLERAAQLQPGYAVWEKLARCYEHVGQDRHALDSYLKALQQQPSSAEVRYHLGALYYRLGDSKKALDYLEPALKLGPSEPLRIRIEQLQEGIRSLSG